MCPPQPEPKFLRNTLDWSDLPGSTTRVKSLKPERDNITCADIVGATAGTTPRSRMKKLSESRLNDTKLNVTDIVGGRFVSQRCTNPLSPRYTMRVETSLGFNATSSSKPDEPPRSASALGGSLTRNTALITIGRVERSHPGWRPRFDNKPEKDAALRTQDITGAESKPTNGLWSQVGGCWERSSRQRRTWRDTMMVRDIDGNEPVLKKVRGVAQTHHHASSWQHQPPQKNPFYAFGKLCPSSAGGTVLQITWPPPELPPRCPRLGTLLHLSSIPLHPIHGPCALS